MRAGELFPRCRTRAVRRSAEARCASASAPCRSSRAASASALQAAKQPRCTHLRWWRAAALSASSCGRHASPKSVVGRWGNISEVGSVYGEDGRCARAPPVSEAARAKPRQSRPAGDLCALSSAQPPAPQARRQPAERRRRRRPCARGGGRRAGGGCSGERRPCGWTRRVSPRCQGADRVVSPCTQGAHSSSKTSLLPRLLARLMAFRRCVRISGIELRQAATLLRSRTARRAVLASSLEGRFAAQRRAWPPSASKLQTRRGIVGDNQTGISRAFC